jgi:transcriptional regulator with XRE-family HTH domain
MPRDLGASLKRARESAGTSLESTATPAKISATYLQKLERGQVQNPSPRVLGRLAAVLGLSYLDVMQLAGYLDKEQAVEAARYSPVPHPLRDAGLNADEWRAVGAFIELLKARRGPGIFR